MADDLKLKSPWLVAAWPGMGNVALNAGVYLLAKLGMTAIAEYEASDLFDVEQVEVKEGLIQPARRPRNRFFVWTDPNKKHDLIVFLGEAQPPAGRFAFSRQVIAFAREQGVERVITFAAMATRMHPEHESRVFAAATDETLTDPNAILDGLTLEILNLVAPPTLTWTRAANGQLTITTDGTLQSADLVAGPYTDLPSKTITVDPATAGGTKFYRSRK